MEFFKNLVNENFTLFVVFFLAIFVLLVISIVLLSVLAKMNRKNLFWIKSQERTIDEYDAKLSETLKNIEDLNSMKARIDNMLTELESNLANASEELESARNTISENKVTINKKDKEIAELTKTLTEKEAEYAKDLNSVISAKNILVEEHAKFVEQHNETVMNLKEEIKSQKEIIAAFTVTTQQLSKNETVIAPQSKKVTLAKPVADMTRQELVFTAKNLGIEGYSRMKKVELITLVENKLKKLKSNKK